MRSISMYTGCHVVVWFTSCKQCIIVVCIYFQHTQRFSGKLFCIKNWVKMQILPATYFSVIGEAVCKTREWLVIANYGSSRPEVFCEKDVVKNLANFTGKHLCFFLIKLIRKIRLNSKFMTSQSG